MFFGSHDISKAKVKEWVLSKIALGRLAFTCLTCISLLLLTSNQMWSQSVDMAHHYALVTRLFDLGNVVAPDPSLGEMIFYPRLSHRIAAWLGTPFNSPIVGLQIAALSSMIAAWVGIVSMLASFGRHVRIRALIAFAVLLIANRIIFKLNIFGSELVDNYFFSQLFAQAGMLCVLAIALLLERCEIRRGYRYTFLIVAILVIEGAHLLPALELLVCMGVLVLSDLVDRWIGKRTASHAGFYTYLLLSGSVLLGTAAAVLVHPTFGAMRMISENNGDLTVNRFGSIMSLVLLAVLVIVSSMLLLIRWQTAPAAIRRDVLPLKYFGALGFAASILFLLQCLALRFGQGSEYACKKYAVALVTVLLVQVVLHFVARRAISLHATDSVIRFRSALGEILLPGIVIALACISVIPKKPALTTTELRKLETQTRQIAPLLTERNSTLPTIAVHLPTMSVLLDYMYTIAVFKAPRNDMIMHLLSNQGPKDFGKLAAIVTARDDAVYDDKACRLPFATADLVTIDAACHRQTQRAAASCRSDFDLTKPGAVDPSMLSGFSVVDESGTWTEGHDASFKCELPPSGTFKPTQVEIVTSAFVYGARQQRVTVSSNATSATQTVKFMRAGDVQTITLRLPESNSGWLTLDFALPDAISPKEVGMSIDDRRLGLLVRAIRFR